MKRNGQGGSKGQERQDRSQAREGQGQGSKPAPDRAAGASKGGAAKASSAEQAERQIARHPQKPSRTAS
jgi:hypothetical protein